MQHQAVTVEAGRADALSEGDARQHAARGVVHQAEEREGRLRAAARWGRHVRRAAVFGARCGRELLAVGLCWHSAEALLPPHALSESLDPFATKGGDGRLRDVRGLLVQREQIRLVHTQRCRQQLSVLQVQLLTECRGHCRDKWRHGAAGAAAAGQRVGKLSRWLSPRTWAAPALLAC